jgi:hypothetical protein
MRLKIYGYSDDLIEIEGDIREEFNCYDEVVMYLGISDGTLIAVEYTEHGFWRFNIIRKGTSIFSKSKGTNLDDDYSDVIYLNGDDLYWVILAKDREHYSFSKDLTMEEVK